ncbi:cilia- and flagella-associated protein 54 [Dromiciops gliroides]|uniref:cilia- and flagella-associated protein 54 n=1 Tax=Dromiciops gliroides TaxID=33562 RepID=UPI001CC4EA22|nr:cilia- and flagella-associated protein 54 [Dromiciops gliroides]
MDCGLAGPLLPEVLLMVPTLPPLVTALQEAVSRQPAASPQSPNPPEPAGVVAVMATLKVPGDRASAPNSPVQSSSSGGSGSDSSTGRSWSSLGARSSAPVLTLRVPQYPTTYSASLAAYRSPPSDGEYGSVSAPPASLSSRRRRLQAVEPPTQNMLLSVSRPLPVRALLKRYQATQPHSECECPSLQPSPPPSPRRLCYTTELPGASFYGPLDAKNPLLASFEKEMQGLLGFLARKHGRAATLQERQNFQRRSANTLFNIWNKYERRLPLEYYNEQLLKVGDSLVQIQEYKLALLQCYGKYLSQFECTVEERDMDMCQFKNIFFPNGLEDKISDLTFHALEGKYICIYHMVTATDPHLHHEISVNQCFNILASLRLIMQVALPQEKLCWIIYNGTIHIYTICRKLMIIGLSAKALEYLLWASICMESSIPLLAVSYLTWRATLYTAVSQCYYDCQVGIQGEIFARRGLGKIDDLIHLEVMSLTPPQEEAKRSFREATIKMAVMIFKRAAFEPRRKTKSFIRMKPRLNLREAQNLQWPRTPTEKLLVEMFDSSSSQFLAVLEALSEPRRRVLQTGPPTSEDLEVREVFAELFMAGGELFSDTSGGPTVCGKFDFFKTICSFASQMKLAVEGKDGVSIAAAVKLIKLSFTFEEWNLFNCTAGQFINFLQSRKDPASRKAEMDLRLLAAMEPLINVKRNKGLAYSGEGGSSATDGVRSGGKKIVFQESHMLSGSYSDDIFHLGSTLFSFICSADEKVHPDNEIVVDLIMFLWQKCKMGIQRIYSAKMEYFKFVQKVKTNKWIHLLWQINEMIHTCQREDLSPVVVAEVALRLSGILETLGNPAKKFKKISGSGNRINVDHGFFHKGSSDILPILKKTPEEQLLLAYETLDNAITIIGMSRTRTTLPDGTSVYDHCHMKVIPPTADSTSGKPLTANTLIMDLQLEIILTQHRIAVTLLDQLKAWDPPLQKPPAQKKLRKGLPALVISQVVYTEKINKNRISKAMYLMQKALLLFEKDPLQIPSYWRLFLEALSLIKKTESEQSALYSYQKDAEDAKIPQGKVPSPPILISRTHCSVTFKPAPFVCDKKVHWYTILGCQMGTCIGKVRLNHHCLPNSGEPVPANEKTLLEVVGLEPNEKYLFAVAAYGPDGELIGDTIGETSKPILIYTPLSTITTRLYLTEVAFQVGKYSLAKKAFAPVWDYFVYTPCPTNASIISLNSMLTITPHRLHTDTLAESSSVLLYHFMRCIFVTSNINIVEQKLFCDAIRGNEVFTCQQAFRLAECQRMLVAIELSTHLNDLSYSLQAVVQCYGLLAPLIFHNIVLVPAIQILIKCLVVLQEIPNVNFPKRQMGNFEGIQHMVACSVYYTTKVLRSWKEFELAVIIINFGKKLLDTSQGLFSNVGKTPFSDDEQEEVIEEGISIKRVKKSKTQIVMLDKISEQLNLMEGQLLKLTKQYPFAELTGAEDPLFLYPIILTWTLRGAMREVMKFKNKPRFLEFFVQVMTKCINEEKFNYVVEMSYTVQNYLKRRNDNFLGIKKGHATENAAANEDPKKYKAAAMEIQKSTELQLMKPKSRKKDALQEYFTKRLSLSELPDLEKFKRADVRKIALKILTDLLCPRVVRYIKRKRLHRLFIEELPWRAQMNVHLANAHFSLFKVKLAERKKIKVCNSQNTMSFRSLDPDTFSFYNSGTLLVEENVNAENYKAMLEFLLSSKTRKTNLSDTDEFSFSSSKVSEVESPKVPVPTESDAGKDRMGNLGILDHFVRTFLHCKRAVVLAHRGGYWTLLQNASRVLWNYALEVQMLLKQAHAFSRTFPVSKDAILCTFVLPFHLASEALLDMLVDLQNSKSLKILDDNKDFGVPSAYGSIEDDDGGFNLTFEDPFDDMNLVDLKYISDFIFKTLEILYRVGKWETLSHIALHFNEITHERYTEQVTPLLVYAQRKLLERIKKFSGQEIIKIENIIEDKINPRNIIGKQPHAAFRPNEAGWRGGFIDFEQDGVHSEMYQANRLVSVPLNVKETLRYFRETLGKSKYHNRSLRYSRKLLTLLLANTQESSGGINNPKFLYGKVEFSLGAEEMYLPTPPDLFSEKFAISTTVESKKLSPSQFQLVIASYEKTIDTLEINNQTDLKIQALHELGNLHIYAENRRAAYKCWSQALDAILKKPDVLHTWKELANPPKTPLDQVMGSDFLDYSEEFLSKAGVWGCLQGGVIAAKMAQYILISNVSERTECCIFSSYFFKALLRTSLIHPKHDHEYAQYDIGQLIPGLDLFCDRHRADVTIVVSSLIYLSYELHSVNHNLIILPLLSLYQYFVAEVCQDLIKCIDAKILKIEILIDLGLLSEAYNEIANLCPGKSTPNNTPSGSKIFGKTKQITQVFEAGKSYMSKENIQALEDLLNRGIPGCVTLLCHPAFIYKFTLVKMRFFISLAETIKCLPESDVKSFYQEFPQRSKLQVMANKEQVKDEPTTTIILTKTKEELTPSQLKGVLLTEAEDKLLTLIENAESVIRKRIIRFNPVELEIMIEVKLQLAAIALQRQQAPFSTSIAFTAIKILQNAEVFQKTKEEIYENRDELDALEPLGMSAREHLNIHMWLRCRLALVVASVAHIHGMGVIKENEVTDSRHLINEVLVEARDWNDTEMQAEVLVQAIKLDLQERHSVAEIIQHLRDIINLLQGKPFVSPRGSLILVKSLILMDDLMKIEEPQKYLSPGNENFNLLNQAHALIIEQVLSLGEMIRLASSDTDYANIIYPLRNIYLPYINLMAKVKMRIAHMLAKKVASSEKRDPSQWESVIHLFEIALYHCRTAAIQENELEAEILFEKGKVERQMLIADETKDMTDDLFEAINKSLKYDQKFGLIRKSYLEIALLYLHMEKNIKKSNTKPKASSRNQSPSKEMIGEKGELYRTLSWMAIRAASQVSEAMLVAQKLIRQKNILMDKIKMILFQNIPEFAVVDITSTYEDYLTASYKAVFKTPFSSPSQSVNIEDSSSLEQELEITESEESEEPIEPDISWVQLVRYYTHLLRINNMNTLLASPKPVYLADEVFHTSVFNADLILRQKEMYNFLKNFLNVFTPACIEPFPKDLLIPVEKLANDENPPSRQSLKQGGQEMSVIIEKFAASKIVPSTPPDLATDFAVYSASKMLCFQWYLPPLEKPPKDTEPMIMLLYAYNTRPAKISDALDFNPSSIFSGYFWVPLNKVMALHEKLSGLRQEAEMLLYTCPLSPEGRSSLSSSTKIIPEVPENILLTKEMKGLFFQCCTEIEALLLRREDLPLKVEVPFEVVLSTVMKLEMLFDPSNGCILKSENIFKWITSLLK